MSYADKLALAENIVKSSSYAIVKEDDVLKQTDRIALNSPMRYILFVMTIVDKYTNIEVDFKNIKHPEVKKAWKKELLLRGDSSVKEIIDRQN